MSAAADCIDIDAEEDATESAPVLSEAASTGQYRRWLLTINNPKDTWREDPKLFWRDLSAVVGHIDGGVFQFEKGSEGTPHIQAAFHSINKCRFITMKNKIRSKSIRGWVAPCKDFEASVRYCSKDDTREAGPYWFGDVTQESAATQGKRSDLAAVAAAAQTGASLKEIAVQHPTSFIKYHHGIQAYLALIDSKPARNFKTRLHIYYGAAGTGKTWRATHTASLLGDTYSLTLSKESHVQWWKGYTGQQSVILDDYNGELPITEWFKLTDRYEYKVRTDQNAWVQFTSTDIFVTCNAHPNLLYAKEFMKNANWKEAFERRIDELIEFKAGTQWSPSCSSSSSSSTSATDVPIYRTDDQQYMWHYHQNVCLNSNKCDCEDELARQL